MDESLDPGALLARSHQIPHGPRVRLRMARPADEPGIRVLLQRDGHRQLDVARLVRFDPRERVAICATALIDSTELIVGVGSIELDSQRDPAPELLVVEEALRDGVGELLERALVGRAEAIRRAA